VARDDAAVYDLGDGNALISTTDFFMPIVDDPHTFGRIAAANAISDVYAMGGRPVLAIGILGWPIAKLAAEIAGAVIEGGAAVCAEAGVALAGGHSIDSPEPIFGLAVNGVVSIANLKRNDTAQVGDLLFLTKPLGSGLLTTAEKRGKLREQDVGLAARQMTELNTIGEALGKIDAVHAMTDVTGFGLLGHLGEMCVGANVGATVELAKVPQITDLSHYLAAGTVPGGTNRNWDSYGDRVCAIADDARSILCDPQTSGGLLVAVGEDGLDDVNQAFAAAGVAELAAPIGEIVEHSDGPYIDVS